MAGINSQGTTFNLPNFNGILYGLTPEDTPLTSAIGVMSDGGEAIYAKDFEWQTYDLRAVENPSHLEGQDAPAPKARVRASVDNVAQIFHSKVEISYTKAAAAAQRNGLNNVQPTAQADEMSWQLTQELKALKRDIEHVFINGTYAKPVNNSSARKTRGILEAITTNVITAPDDDGAGAGTTGVLTEAMVLDLMQDVWENGGITEQETATFVVNAAQKRRLTKIFVTDKNYQEMTRNVGGVSLQTIETDFGKLNIMLNRYMPAGTVLLASMEMLKPRILEIPGKGFLFLEPLAKTGAADAAQIYGEIGLEYGNQLAHGKIVNLTP